MKQMLKDMKMNSLISLLPKIVITAVLGVGGLLMGQEYPIILVIAAVMLLLMLWLLISSLSGILQKKAKAFIANLNAAEQEKLVWDYQNAWKGSRTIRIGKDFTFVCDDGSRIYRNSEIIWVYAWYENGAHSGIGSSKHYYFNLYLIDKQEPEILGTTEKTYQNILKYYEDNFSHIVVGQSDEAGYLYRNDRNQFLHLKYYSGQE
ncbi:MAG: hypothetical protein HDR23_08555 [Lachnospiraceae bacterium]|nr:hypothetical protein [Lachnospiraceae bacterium]